MITVTAKEFNRNASRLRREASVEPVYITDRGKVRHALVSIEYLDRLSGGPLTGRAALSPSVGGFLLDAEANELVARSSEAVREVEL